VIDRNVAIKTFCAHLSAAEKKQADQQFINEARAAGRLCHPNIVTIYDAGSEGGTTYIAMEYLQGTELSKLLNGGHKFAPDEVASIAWKLADALAHAHKNGVIHRDIKPANIFMLAENQPKIFDFGIARAPNRIQDQQTEDEQPYTLFRNNLLGTPHYMSPEQATGRQVDQLTDVYSLGAVMYEMLVHRKPFESDNIDTVLESIARKAPSAPSELNKEVPLRLSEIVMKAMRKRPGKRYQSAQEMAEDISRYLTSEKGKQAAASAPLSKPEQSGTSTSGSRLRLLAASAALAALAVSGYLWLH
jgi:serine/threonine-protein kinase